MLMRLFQVKIAPSAQVDQLKSIPRMFLIPSLIKGFAAIAVKNMAELIKFAWEPTSIKNAPILFGFIPALEFKELDNELTMGAIIPPPRAVLEGTTGARINSVRQIE